VEFILDGPGEILSDQPIMVAQFATSGAHDGMTGDPAMMLVPSVDQFVTDAWIPASSSTLFDTDRVNIVVPSASIASIQMDGVGVPSFAFSAIGNSGYSGTALSVGKGRHHVTGSGAFSVMAYGFATDDAYGWSGALLLSPRNRLTLTGPSSAERWQAVTFNLAWMNREAHAVDFRFWDTIPAGTVFESATGGGKLSGNVVSWAISGIPAGWTGAVSYTVRVSTSTDKLSQAAIGEYATTAAPCLTPVFSNTLVVSVSAPRSAPVKVYPNPFNPGKAVNGSVKFRGMRVGGKIRVYTISGRLVWDAVAGVDPVEWNGKNKAGEEVVPGIYLWTSEGELGKERGKIFLQR